MMLKTFVLKRRDLTKQELIDFNSFCQILPGASSTQTIMLIGYKRGGAMLSIATLIVWLLPACLMMGIFSFFLTLYPNNNLVNGLFKYIQPMAIGFLIFATVNTFKISIRNYITFVIMLLSCLITIWLFKSPWIFPLLIVLGGIATNFSNKRIPNSVQTNKYKIKWSNLWFFVLIFIIAGFLSEYARKEQWQNKKSFNLFENFYRFGSIVFGGSDVLLPLMLDQYVARPQSSTVIKRNPNIIKIERSDLLTGYGIVRAIPGPVFSVATFTGGMALKEEGYKMQLVGCLIGTVGIFLPSALLVLFFFPVWQHLKKYVVVFRALEGINAVVVGVMCSGAFYLLNGIIEYHSANDLLVRISIIIATFLLLKKTRLNGPVIVFLFLLLGFIF
jgi:chromate transporter